VNAERKRTSTTSRRIATPLTTTLVVGIASVAVLVMLVGRIFPIAADPIGVISATPAAPAVPASQPGTQAAGTPLKGWPTVSAQEWPEPGNAATLIPNATPIVVRSAPDSSSPGVTLKDGQATAGKVVFLAVGHVEGWWKVLVPARPNGTVGWLPDTEVTMEVISTRIVVELSTSKLRFYSGDRVILETTVASGTGKTPTPTGLFAVKEIVKQKNPKGFLGPLALGLTGFSEVLYDYAGGQGTVALHGTSAPSKLGQRVSHGCVRMDNRAIASLGAQVPLGTPVEIVRTLSDLPKERWNPPVLPE
jgi:lipoprotein-anchoring transpeptidase ErfK/SrfK